MDDLRLYIKAVTTQRQTDGKSKAGRPRRERYSANQQYEYLKDYKELGVSKPESIYFRMSFFCQKSKMIWKSIRPHLFVLYIPYRPNQKHNIQAHLAVMSKGTTEQSNPVPLP